MMSSSTSLDLSNNLMNIQDDISEFASVDHLGSIFLNGIEMLIELSNKGFDSQKFKKAVDSFKQSIRQNKSRDDKRKSDPLRNAGYEFCEAISMVFNDISKNAKVAPIQNEVVLARPVPQSQHNNSKPTRETRSTGKKTIFLQRTFKETVDHPVQPLLLLRCGDCPAIFKTQTARLEHRQMHAIEAPSAAESVKSRADRKRKAVHFHEDVIVHPIKTARLAIAAPPPKDEMQCQYCEKLYKTARWLNKHLSEKHNCVVLE